MPKTCKYGRTKNSRKCRANYQKKSCRKGFLRAPPEYLCKKSKIYVPLYVRNRDKPTSVRNPSPREKPLAKLPAVQERHDPIKATLAGLKADTETKKSQADLAKKRVDEHRAKMNERLQAKIKARANM